MSIETKLTSSTQSKKIENDILTVNPVSTSLALPKPSEIWKCLSVNDIIVIENIIETISKKLYISEYFFNPR